MKPDREGGERGQTVMEHKRKEGRNEREEKQSNFSRGYQYHNIFKPFPIALSITISNLLIIDANTL